MCGYARRHISSRQLHELANLLNDGGLVIRTGVDSLAHFYPAFGGNHSRELNDLIIAESDTLQTVDATWWFDCRESESELIVNNALTTFNARNLASGYWKGAIRNHRAIFVATGIGEGKLIGGKNHHYLVESEKPILLGCVFRKYKNGKFSTAIITRNSHPRFEPYHDKAFPLMLPHDSKFLRLWLSDAREDEPAIANLLEHPKIFNDLTITQVKTFKDAKAIGESISLSAD